MRNNIQGAAECDAKGTKWIYDVVEAEDDRFISWESLL